MVSISTSRHPDDGSAHIRVSVFVGPDRDHRALAGVLVFRRGEDDEFIRRVEDQYQQLRVRQALNDAATALHTEFNSIDLDQRAQIASWLRRQAGS